MENGEENGHPGEHMIDHWLELIHVKKNDWVPICVLKGDWLTDRFF